jgi:hypothetical protein
MLLPLINRITRLGGPLRGLGPYAAIELLVPGGSLIVLSLWVLRNRAWFIARARRTLIRFAALMPHSAPAASHLAPKG